MNVADLQDQVTHSLVKQDDDRFVAPSLHRRAVNVLNLHHILRRKMNSDSLLILGPFSPPNAKELIEQWKECRDAIWRLLQDEDGSDLADVAPSVPTTSMASA